MKIGEGGRGGGAGYTERLRHDQVAGGKDQGARLLGGGGALASRLFARSQPTDTKDRTKPIFGGELREDNSGTHRCGGTCNGQTPPGADRDLGAGQGRKRGERTGTGNGNRIKHAARGAETSGGGWHVLGTGDVKVGGDSHQKRRWGAGVN